MNNLIIVPIGSFEEHGPHLLPETDYLIAKKIAREISLNFKGKMIKGMNIGISPEHMGFKTTKSITEGEFIALIEEFIKKFQNDSKFIIINAHGGNNRALNSIQKKFKKKMLVINTFSIIKEEIKQLRTSKIGGICHAGEFETSLMLYLYPEKVKLNRLNKNSIKYVPSLDVNYTHGKPLNWKTIDYSTIGIIGDPFHGTRVKGKKWYLSLINNSEALIKNFLKHF